MINFSIGIQLKKEIEEFNNKKIKLATPNFDSDSVRYLKNDNKTYFYNQRQTINIVDLYYNSKFENGAYDKQKQRKIFLNVGKFRCEVASKQIDLDVKDFNFKPTDYADPWESIFLQRDFHEWTKETYFGELINKCVEAFPKYGTVVLKNCDGDLHFVHLQNLINDQSAESLQKASYVIEVHPDMHIWEMQEMKDWNCEGLDLNFSETGTVYERYGRVPLSFIKKVNNEEVQDGDHKKYVDALVISMFTKTKDGKDNIHVFFAEQITSRPYLEAHWNKQYGRWLGLGTMEDLIENQQAKNIIVNLIKRSLQWSAKRLFQGTDTSTTGKNLVRDAADGDIVEVGPNGDIRELNLSAKTNADFSAFLNEFERNSDQKAFTYEVATGEGLPSGTPFRLGVVLSNAVNSFYNLKREKLGIFLKKAICEFLVPQFLMDMTNEEKVLNLFSGENGYEVVKSAAMDYFKLEAARVSLLSGRAVDISSIMQIISPYEMVQALFIKRSTSYYKETAKWKFDFDPTGEDTDYTNKVETLKTLYQLLIQKNDPRAENVLAKLANLTGEPLSQFGQLPEANPQMGQVENQVKNLQLSNGKQQTPTA